MTEELFSQFYDNIFVPEVITYLMDGTEYSLYSQAVPKTAVKRDEIEYYLFLILRKDIQDVDQVQVWDSIFDGLILCSFIIMCTVLIVLTAVLLIAWFTAKRIIMPISDMTRYTDKMK